MCLKCWFIVLRALVLHVPHVHVQVFEWCWVDEEFVVLLLTFCTDFRTFCYILANKVVTGFFQLKYKLLYVWRFLCLFFPHILMLKVDSESKFAVVVFRRFQRCSSRFRSGLWQRKHLCFRGCSFRSDFSVACLTKAFVPRWVRLAGRPCLGRLWIRDWWRFPLLLYSSPDLWHVFRSRDLVFSSTFTFITNLFSPHTVIT